MPSWHASSFLCLLGVDSSMESHVTSYSSQGVDGQFSDPEVGMLASIIMMFMMIH